jgi:hypothetical protein
MNFNLNIYTYIAGVVKTIRVDPWMQNIMKIHCVSQLVDVTASLSALFMSEMLETCRKCSLPLELLLKWM